MTKKRRANPIIRIGLFGIVLVLVINLMIGLMQINEKKKEIDSIAVQSKVKKADIVEINGILGADDKEIIEKYARDKLGFGAPNEQVYIDISGN